MEKKLLLLTGLCMLGFVTGIVQAVNPKTDPLRQETDIIPHGYDIIVLQGSLVFGMGPNAIEVGVNDNNVYIQFNQNFGTVAIKLYNPNGVNLYSGDVNTAVQQQLFVPVTFATEGTYYIFIENAWGYAEGEFEK